MYGHGRPRVLVCYENTPQKRFTYFVLVLNTFYASLFAQRKLDLKTGAVHALLLNSSFFISYLCVKLYSYQMKMYIPYVPCGNTTCNSLHSFSRREHPAGEQRGAGEMDVPERLSTNKESQRLLLSWR